MADALVSRTLHVALALALATAPNGSVLAQSAPPATTPPATTPPAPAAAAPAAAPATPDLAGSWTGSAKLSNDWPNFPCLYAGAASPPAVSLELKREGENLKGTLTLDVPAAAGSKCPPLRKRYAVSSVTATPSSAVLHDSAGHDWSLALREDQLAGIVGWKGGSERGEVLADGFFGPGGTLPLTRLSGEIALARVGAAAAGAKAAAPASAGGATAAGGAAGAAQGGGGLFSGVAGIIGANIVGIGALVGANRLLRDNKTTASGNDNSCSRRTCSGTPVDCETCTNLTFIAGGPCGNVPGGVPVGSPCDVPNQRPCQANLSCDNGICEDAGVCQF